MNFTPRNTAVVLRLILPTERVAGNIVVPTNGDLYSEAEVIAVGPGNIAAQGGRTETFDLRPGQRVFAKVREQVPDRTKVTGRGTVIAGIEYREGDVTYHIFEQMSILGILAEPGDFPKIVSDLTVA